MSQLGSWTILKWSSPIWLRGLGVSWVSLPGWMRMGSLAPSLSGKRAGTEREKGLWAQICTYARQKRSICFSTLLFNPFPLRHVPGQKPDANSDSWQSKAWTTVGRRCTQLLFQWIGNYHFPACETNSPLEGPTPWSGYFSCVGLVKLFNLWASIQNTKLGLVIVATGVVVS